jgi:hypothetical protein
MATQNVSKEDFQKLVKVVKAMRGEIADLWERVNRDDSNHGEMEDETRQIAERARRAVVRIEKRLKEEDACVRQIGEASRWSADSRDAREGT